MIYLPSYFAVWADTKRWGCDSRLRPHLLVRRCQCLLLYAILLVSMTKVLRSFLAMTSRIMPAMMSRRPAMTSITAPISVGKWVTTPVLANSKVTVPQSTMTDDADD